jgi:MFS family permease
LLSKDEEGMTLKELFKNKIFWLLMLMMLCAGASEQGVSQWASAFAEKGLNVSKTVGDLAGPMAFATLMGIARAIYGKFGDRIKLDKFMALCTGLCVISYLIICFAPWPLLSLIGCGICGFSVGIMWPGTFSTASVALRRGGTAMFAMLALAGDLGCGGGPTLVGFMTDVFNGNMQWGILTAIIFPIILLLCIILRKNKKQEKLLNK